MTDDHDANIRESLETQAEPAPGGEPGDGIGESAFSGYGFLMVLTIGAMILAYYLASLIQAIEYAVSRPSMTPFSEAARPAIDFRLLASRIFLSQGFLFAVIGAAVVLLALHWRNEPASNRWIAVVLVFCALNAALMAVCGVTMLASTGHVSESLSSSYFTQPGASVLAVIEILAFLVIILMELPGAREKIARRFKSEKPEDPEDKVEDEPGAKTSGPV
jgi:hypothetical protein